MLQPAKWFGRSRTKLLQRAASKVNDMYRVEVKQLPQDGILEKSAVRSDDSLPIAVCEAVRGSGTYTARSFVLGVIANAVVEEVFRDDNIETHERMIAILKDFDPIPINVRRDVELALE